MKVFIGIDVSKQRLDVAVLKNGNIESERAFLNRKSGIMSIITKIGKLADRKEIVFGCEPTGVYHRMLVRMVHEYGYCIKLINPRFTKHEAMANGVRDQTDKVDAALIARRLEAERSNDRFWAPEDEGIVEIRDLLKRRHQLKKMIQQENNRNDRFCENKFVAKSLENSLKTLRAEKKAIEKKIYELKKADPELNLVVELFRTIPGVGFWTAISFTAKIGDHRRFKKASQVVAYLGLSPLRKVSGTSVQRGMMSRQGESMFRSTLYMAAVAAIRGDNVYSAYHKTLEERGNGYKYGAAAVMRKMVRVMFAIWRDGEPFSEERYGEIYKKSA